MTIRFNPMVFPALFLFFGCLSWIPVCAEGGTQANHAMGRGYDSVFVCASNVSIPAVGSSWASVNWKAGSGDGVVVMMRRGEFVQGLPSDDVRYHASTDLGSGNRIDSEEYVIYRGPANSVTVRGLIAETTYHVAVFEYIELEPFNEGMWYFQKTPARGVVVTSKDLPGHNEIHGIVNCDQCHALHGGSVVAHGTDQLTVCAQCHNATGSASAKIDIGLHVVDNGATVIDCGTCHEVHNGYDFNTTDTHIGGVTAPNISWIRSDVTKYVISAIEPAVFQVRPDHFAFGKQASGPPYNGICQACHTSTSMHNNTGVGGSNNHQIGMDCTICHAHLDGFLN